MLTAVSLIAPDGRQITKLSEAAVTFRNISEREVADYLATGEWKGVAGAYKYQGLASKFVRSTQGNAPTIIGLPVYEVSQMLTSLGYHA